MHELTGGVRRPWRKMDGAREGPVLPRAVALAILGVAGACAGPGGAGLSGSGGTTPADVEPPPRMEIPAAGTRAGRAPEWAERPLTPAKLEDLEIWIAGEGLRYDVYWQLEGELQLAEGRLQLDRRAAGPGFGASALARLRSAFEHVRDHRLATVAQRQRAEMGLRAVDGPAAAPAASSLVSGVLPRSQWGARAANARLMNPARDAWRWITVHHSAMPGAATPDGSLASSARALREIQAAHMNGEGYGDIGYHYLIDPAGRVFTGRELRYQGAHAGGDNNRGNVGVCLIGNFEHERPTRAALGALDGLIAKLADRYRIPPRRVKPHGYWKNTACPGRHLAEHLTKYR